MSCRQPCAWPRRCSPWSPTFCPRSGTLQRQCAAIARARFVRIDLQVGPKPVDARTRAHAVIRRYDSGLLLVRIEIPVLAEYAELIAHEFEHVLEQIEGVDVRSNACGKPANGRCETARAQQAERQAAAEIHQDTDRTSASTGRGLAGVSRSMWRVLAGTSKSDPEPER